MSDLRKAAEMALEALEHAAECVQTNYLPDKCGHDWDEQIEALRQALAQPEQEPVAWGFRRKDGAILDIKNADEHEGYEKIYTVPLYTTPSNREWVGLTKEEFEQAVDGLEDLEDCWAQIEAKLKEKNT